MKTNVSIELSDEQRDHLANLIDGKVTKRLATRKDVVDMVLSFVSGMAEEQSFSPTTVDEKKSVQSASTVYRQNSNDLLRIDPEDAEHLKDKCESYIKGWNDTKRRLAAARKRP